MLLIFIQKTKMRYRREQVASGKGFCNFKGSGKGSLEKKTFDKGLPAEERASAKIV